MIKSLGLVLALVVSARAFSTSCSILNLTQIPNTLAYSGYLNISQTSQSAIAFLFYGVQNKPLASLSNYPLTIWLQGGPGDSSQIANFFGVGPINLNTQGQGPSANPNSWNAFTNLLFLDAPVGTGFSPLTSPSDVANSTSDAVAQITYALNQFFSSGISCLSNIKTTFGKNSKIYVFGEHYAAQFAAQVAKNFIDGLISPLNVTGLGMGDPLINILASFNNAGFYGYYMGLLDIQERSAIQGLAIAVDMAMKANDTEQAYNLYFSGLIDVIVASGGVSPYNIYALNGSAVSQFNYTFNYFTDKSNLELYNFSDAWGYSVENLQIQDDFAARLLLYENAVNDLEAVLSSGIQVMAYNGQWDLISNNPGFSQWMDQLQFESQTKFNQAQFLPLNVPNYGNNAGSYKQAGNLQMIIVNKSGRFVNIDQPKVLNYIAQEFIK